MTSTLERLRLYLNILTPFEPKVEAQRTQRAISNEKARFLFLAYSHHENKEIHMGNAKFGNNT
jgi:hypothetical protein